jgi:glycosyltransferase involved in cell wall biosynthesis
VHLTTIDMSLSLLLLPQLVAIREAGYDVVGVSAPGPYVGALEEHGIRHVPLTRSTRANNVRADVQAAREFGEICRRLRPEVVHTHNPKPGVYGRIVARLAGVPAVVNTVHGLYAQTTDPLARRAAVYGLERVAATFSHAELVQNPEDIPVLRRLGVPHHRIRLLGNGVDLCRFDPQRHGHARDSMRSALGIGRGEVVVGLVGRLVREKGYREVFAAAQRLRRTQPCVRFVVVGPEEPDKTDAITPTERDAARDGGVLFLGARRDVEQLYPMMDLYVLASHREGFPRSAMEAAAMGLPIVATDIRGCRQVVEHGRTGVLVPSGAADALELAIALLANDPELRHRMGSEGRRKAQGEFDDRRQVAVTLETYDRLLPADRERKRVPQ